MPRAMTFEPWSLGKFVASSSISVHGVGMITYDTDSYNVVVIASSKALHQLGS